ncbi:TRAP transporter substrate-binding protein [Thermodesulfobacteriota bacterium]
MKKIGWVIGILAITLLIAGGFVNTSEASQGKVWKLKGSCFFPPSGARWDNGMQFIKKVKERTNGRVVIDLVPSGGLAPVREEYEHLGKKLIDFALGADAFIGAIRNAFGIFNVPGVNAKDAPALLKAGVLDVFNRVAKKDKVKFISGWQSLGYQAIATRKKFIKKPADFKGAMFFAQGPFFDKAVDAFGAKPTPVPVAELYTGLQTGVVDGIITTVSALQSFKIAEVCPYSSIFPGSANLGFFAYLPAFNLEVWNSFPADIQKIILQAGAEVAEQSLANWSKGRKKTEAFLKSKSDRVFTYELSENEAKAFIETVREPVKEFYLKRGGQDEKDIYAIIDKFYGR